MFLEARRVVKQIDKRFLHEMACHCGVPPLLTSLMQVLCIFLQPDLPDSRFTWNERRKLLRTSDFIEKLLTFDTEKITTE